METFDEDAEHSVPLRSARVAQARLTQENPDSPSPSESSAQRRASTQLSTASESSNPLQTSSGNNVEVPSPHASAVRSPPMDISPSSQASGRILRSPRAMQIPHPDILQRRDSSFARRNQRLCTSSRQPSQHVNPECISDSSELPSTSRGNDQRPFRFIVKRKLNDAITDQPPKVCRVSKSRVRTGDVRPVNVRSGTSSSSATSEFLTSASMSSPVAASSTASTSTGRRSSTKQSVPSVLPKSQLPSTSAANIPKPINNNNLLVPLKETDCPCLDLANVDSTDTTADNSAAGVSDTDSSISSSLFACSELASTSRGNDQQPFRSSFKRKLSEAISDKPSKVCRVSKSRVRTGDVRPVNVGGETSSSSATSEFLTSVSMSSPLAASGTASTSTGSTSSTTQSVLPVLPKSQLPSTSAANIPKQINENIVPGSLKETGSPCVDLTSEDSSDTSVNKPCFGLSDTDSSISSSLFVWSGSSAGSGYSSTETAHPLSSSSVEVITDPEENNDDISPNVSSGVEDEELTTHSSPNSVSIVDPEEEPDDCDSRMDGRNSRMDACNDD